MTSFGFGFGGASGSGLGGGFGGGFGGGLGGGFGGDDTAAAASKTLIIEPSTPWIAAGDGDLNLLRASIERLGLSAGAADENGFTFVHAAASYCRLDVLRWLLLSRPDARAVVNAGDSDGDTPLHHCDEVDAARCLIEEGGADFGRRNDAGLTAREAKEEELAEGDGDDDDSDDEDRKKMKELVAYLRSLEGGSGGEDVEMQ